MSEIPSVSREVRREAEVESVARIYQKIDQELTDRELGAESMDTIAILTLATVINSGDIQDTVLRYKAFAEKEIRLESMDTAVRLV
jgi:hypothetical protein